METKMINVTINGKEYSVQDGTTILEAAKTAHVEIPTLCYLKGINAIGSCRMCVVEVEGMRTLQAACVYPIRDGMVINTQNSRVRDSRKMNMELILSNHDMRCLSCNRNNKCELRTLAGDLGIEEVRFESDFKNPENRAPLDDTNPSLVRDNNKCILCRRCVSVCKNVQRIQAIDVAGRGMHSHITGAFDRDAKDTECVLCGQCINVCPTGALSEKRSIDKVFDALNDSAKHVVVQIAPAVRAGLGEEFGYPIGTDVTGKMFSAARKLGFDGVFDTNTGADLTILEEGNELLHRLQNNGKLPMMTSCSPGWVKYCEHFYPDFIDNLSTAKSPHMMFGAVLKSPYYAKKANVDPKDIITVSVMPCVAKKYEAQREEFEVDGNRDVDYVITSREFAAMIKEAGINFKALEDEAFDNPFTEASGAGAIFGVTGGVMEAALRTVAETLAGKKLDSIDFKEARGENGIKEIHVDVNGTTLKAAVCSGVGNAKKLLEKIKADGGKSEYQFIEVMGCPGGCIMGGGQPLVDSLTREKENVFQKRASVLYSIDTGSKIRRSHENEDLQKLYTEFLDKPNSKLAHKYLHTHYHAKDRFGKI